MGVGGIVQEAFVYLRVVNEIRKSKPMILAPLFYHHFRNARYMMEFSLPPCGLGVTIVVVHLALVGLDDRLDVLDSLYNQPVRRLIVVVLCLYVTHDYMSTGTTLMTQAAVRSITA